MISGFKGNQSYAEKYGTFPLQNPNKKSKEIIQDDVLSAEDFIDFTFFINTTNTMEVFSELLTHNVSYNWETVPSDMTYDGVCFNLDLEPLIKGSFLDSEFTIWISFNGSSK